MSATRSSYEGSCHYGAIGYIFTTSIPPGEWAVRACQCSFCRAHGGFSTSDLNGSVRFVLSEPGFLSRYRFALQMTDFLLCNRCGVYIGAVMHSPDRPVAVINLNALVKPPAEIPEAKPVSYESESASERRSQREAAWTPVEGAV